jgi:hypothetical protein
MEIKLTPLHPWQEAAIRSPFTHTALFSGIACGKTFTGCHFVIKHVLEKPHLTGFIGANNYDQMSMATLRELFYWLETYGFEYVIDRRPPAAWNAKSSLKSHNNVLSIFNKWAKITTTIFTRILSDPNALRGFEASWYWIDETRDTEQEAHDVLLSRLRESNYIKGLITTTTNGESWDLKRFGMSQDMLYGSIHVATEMALKVGLITADFYNALRRSYSPLMAAQELDAKHVNVAGGRAYYASGDHNRIRTSLWGDEFPNPDRPLIVGCDYNYSPAPCTWIVGQMGPSGYEDCLHIFGEIALSEASAPQMATTLMNKYPGFFYKIYGDASENRGTVSNAGYTSYNQVADTLSDGGCMFNIDVDQGNPRVFDCVENLNAGFRNALGETLVTYNPDTCPMLDSDLRVVGWKQSSGRGMLDNNSDLQRTHASDALRYAWWKINPPGRRATLLPSIQSQVREGLANF